MSEPEKSLVQRWLQRVENHPILAVIIILIVLITGLGGLIDSTDKISMFWKKYIARENSNTHYLAPESKPLEQPQKPKLFENKLPPVNVNKKLEESNNKIIIPSNVTPAESQPDIRQEILAIANAIEGEHDSYRIDSIKESLSLIPENLTAPEVSKLIGNISPQYRSDALELLVSRMKFPITAKDAIHLLGSTYDFYRIECLSLISPLIENRITEEDMLSLLEGTSGPYKADAIRALSEGRKLRTHNH